MPKFSIGIDLGTTNCALAFVSLREETGASEVLPLPQHDDPRTLVERSALPSFLYLPSLADQPELTASEFAIDGWVTGLLARKRAAVTPGRVVHSAKSWLGNHTVDPADRLLPWNSEEVGVSEKLSPVAASAAYLSHLRNAWNRQMAATDSSRRFELQTITVTVPASFDAAAQRATRDAAELAGFPSDFRLLEEPQAAFYRYLEASSASNQEPFSSESHILVVDVGGGTSDFSLFRVEGTDKSGSPSIERVAVSEHILLGGDNIDLALAHILEAELVPEGEELSGESWGHLLARSRELKERCLADESIGEETLHISVPGRGSGLFGGTLSTSVPAAQVREILLDGFFPSCAREARPAQARSALQEWGLPYASDFAITRYLADFLREHPPVDAVLFNGGTLCSALVRSRLLEQVTTWQDGHRPAVLDNPETALAVARGAARYGCLITRRAQRIEAGAARAIFLEVSARTSQEGSAQLLCVLPRGAPPEQIFVAAVPGLRLQVNRPVQFKGFQGIHHRSEQAGAVVTWSESEFTSLPTLESRVELDQADKHDSVPVHLESQLNELGLLQIELVSGDRRWPLIFNLRRSESAPPAAMAPEDPTPARHEVDRVDDARVAKARPAVRHTFDSSGRSLTPASVLKTLERSLASPRNAWSLSLCRTLADEFLACVARRNISPEHTEIWLSLTGFLLRPGFGDPLDPGRVEQLWQAVPPGAYQRARRLELQALILWRRLADGLCSERQEALLDACEPILSDSRKATAEHVRLAGSLSKLPPERKERLIERFVERVADKAENGYPAPYLAALSQLLARAPFHGGPELTVSPGWVEWAFKRLKSLDWTDPSLAEMIPLFLRAARRVETAECNVPPSVGRKIADRLSKAGVLAPRLTPLRDYVPLTREEQVSLYREPLPSGLVLS